uniref:Dihydropteridine reductase n=1 Tax=Vannella robusta TaxID=1487602 RepID=A0A7S4IAM6_9EUKA|mmetsp:Transcript_22870/g.29174  ORF Transcript_22870/g.29174 Transcript_22870/m.29174 type:complete len:228 (+) Transcript_22870:85-768(+)
MPSALVYGGAGQLGDAIVRVFSENGFDTFCVDFRESSTAKVSICLTGEVQSDVDKVAEQLTNEKASLDVVICAAGGWAGGDIKSKDILAGVDKMYKFNIQSAVACSHLASHYLKEGGLLVLTGAAAATGPTPGMIAYGITKAATHHLISSLAEDGLPKDAVVAGILPICLDTQTNRQGMPNANFDDWTPLDTVANMLLKWSKNEDRPETGSLIKITTKSKETSFEKV